MLLSDAGLYHELGSRQLIDARYPLWWSNGFEGSRYVEPSEFFGGLEDFDGRPVQPGDDMENIRYTVIRETVAGLQTPLFVTVKPIDADHIDEERRYGKDKMFPVNAETYPHVRGVALAMTDDVIFWYPTTGGLGVGGRIAYEGLELRDHSHFTEPRVFFANLLNNHMYLKGRRRLYCGRNDQRDIYPEFPRVPFFELSADSHDTGKMTIVPADANIELHLPMLVVREQASRPVIMGFTNDYLYLPVHKSRRSVVKNSVEELLGLECEIRK